MIPNLPVSADVRIKPDLVLTNPIGKVGCEAGWFKASTPQGIFIVTPSLEGQPTKDKEAPSPHENYDTSHALNCKIGGFVTVRHNNIKDYEANLLAKIYTGIETETSLQPIEREIVNGIPDDNARPSVRARDGEIARTCFLIFKLLTLTLQHIIT